MNVTIKYNNKVKLPAGTSYASLTRLCNKHLPMFCGDYDVGLHSCDGQNVFLIGKYIYRLSEDSIEKYLGIGCSGVGVTVHSDSDNVDLEAEAILTYRGMFMIDCTQPIDIGGGQTNERLHSLSPKKIEMYNKSLLDATAVKTVFEDRCLHGDLRHIRSLEHFVNERCDESEKRVRMVDATLNGLILKGKKHYFVDEHHDIYVFGPTFALEKCFTSRLGKIKQKGE